MKIIFLDIDGVLNDNDYHLGSPQILPRCVDQFNRIVAATDCKIVLSSSWRSGIYSGWYTVRGFGALLESHGVRGWLIGCTPKPGLFDRRDEEVLEWLKAKDKESPVAYEPVTSWVCIDDWDDELTGLGDRFVGIDGGVGLTADDASKAIDILRRPIVVEETIVLGSAELK